MNETWNSSSRLLTLLMEPNMKLAILSRNCASWGMKTYPEESASVLAASDYSCRKDYPNVRLGKPPDHAALSKHSLFQKISFILYYIEYTISCQISSLLVPAKNKNWRFYMTWRGSGTSGVRSLAASAPVILLVFQR